MTARHRLRKNCERYSQTENMGTGTPKAAGSSTPFVRPLPPSAVDVDCLSVSMDPAGPPCDRNTKHQVGPAHQEEYCESSDGRLREGIHVLGKNTKTPRPASCAQDIPEPLAELIAKMIHRAEGGGELFDAYLYAAELPPITRQSLSELDVPNFITNIKLRHDINFDRDLSFRPNLDGAKGQEKLKATAKYWKALVAELELYVRLFDGSSPLLNHGHAGWPVVIEQAKKRIPKMFETIKEVLKGLVPERDHSRVDDHLDTPMLMQEIERGVCDLVRRAEWLANLLKEHCAPMRDELVDKMVEEMKLAATKSSRSSEQIVKGLRELMGILEAMKLDVANHQIRHLKTLLIEDTVNFERHYHLERLVHGRTRVNTGTAHQWYQSALAEFRVLCMPPQKDILRLHLEVFVRAVVASLFASDSHCDFPETFYLDQDRLRALKAEIDDLVYFEVCFDMFGQLLRDFGFTRPIPQTSRHILRSSLSAIIGEGVGYGPSQWMMNSENISAELIQQALVLIRYPAIYSFDLLQQTNQRLCALFDTRFQNYASTLEAYLLPQILSLVNRHIHSSSVELFNTLITIPSLPLSPPPHAPLQPFLTNNTLSPDTQHFADLANRISHIILLHWRIWGPIAYVLEDPSTPQISPPNLQEEVELSTLPPPPPPPSASHTLPPPPPPPPPPSVESTTADAQIVSVLKTGEPPDSGQGALGFAGSSVP